ncbi:MAG: hypothetical protein U5K75_01520 [Ahrensia sp.]|nr:hypothetical protein [Ahrensia sp.]
MKMTIRTNIDLLIGALRQSTYILADAKTAETSRKIEKQTDSNQQPKSPGGEE